MSTGTLLLVSALNIITMDARTYKEGMQRVSVHQVRHGSDVQVATIYCAENGDSCVVGGPDLLCGVWDICVGEQREQD